MWAGNFEKEKGKMTQNQKILLVLTFAITLLLCYQIRNLVLEVEKLERKVEMTGVRSYFIGAPDEKSVYEEFKLKWQEDMKNLEKLRDSD
jgi:hypothetical protein